MNDRHRSVQRIAFRLAKKRTSEADWKLMRAVMRLHYEVRRCNVNRLAAGLLPLGATLPGLSLEGYAW